MGGMSQTESEVRDHIGGRVIGGTCIEAGNVRDRNGPEDPVNRKSVKEDKPDAGRQASGRILDELTTILKYKDLEAVQAEGISFSFLPRSTTVPNGTLLCNGKSARDRNRKVAPMIISEKFAEAGHPLKTSNNRWLDMLNTLYVEQLFILNWLTSVPPPGPDFDLKALSASQLCALVVPYLRMHLGAMYEVDLGQDDEDNNSEAETMKTKKCKGKSKKSNDNRRTKGTIVEQPDIVLSIREWSEYDVKHLESQSPSMYLIPLVIDTNGEVLRELQDLVKCSKDFPLPDQASTKQVTEELPSSDQEAVHSTPVASRPTQVAPCPTKVALHPTQVASRPTQVAPRPTKVASCPTQVAPHSKSSVYSMRLAQPSFQDKDDQSVGPVEEDDKGDSDCGPVEEDNEGDSDCGEIGDNELMDAIEDIALVDEYRYDIDPDDDLDDIEDDFMPSSPTRCPTR
ncbi:uncharacterized protein F5147DRAFT_779283 [Suillus discolor]|uniref:Uncharacterized protein n=1 Tax=Suillus discolor TaxID=1912936 RepID=A0A9P7EVN8_9AGAM|nr:uncharacterized protein F5147DRAFT_779283 [Suillus discolor]KAG2093766.1 hypothetical protein F5147DRAFT_779283 [Suillus discolor]